MVSFERIRTLVQQLNRALSIVMASEYERAACEARIRQCEEAGEFEAADAHFVELMSILRTRAAAEQEWVSARKAINLLSVES